MSNLFTIRRGLKFLYQHNNRNLDALWQSRRCAHDAPLISDPFLWAARRKREAHRSILVDNWINQDPQKMVDYCHKFGEVKAAFAVPTFADTEKPRDLLLIEFKNPDARLGFINSLNKTKDGYLYTCSAECRLIGPLKGNIVRHRKISIVKHEVQDNKALIQQMADASSVGAIWFLCLSYLIWSLQLSDQMQLLQNACQMHETDTRMRFLLLTLLEDIVSSLFYGMKLEPFGSVVSQLGSSSSDVDLVITRPTQAAEERFKPSPLTFNFKKRAILESPKGKVEMMRILGSYLQFCHPTFFQVQPILRARVPIIRIKHSSGIDIDISCTNNTAILMSKILFYLCTYEPCFKTLLITIKFWAKHLGITTIPGSGYPTNFTLTSMLVFFLQNKAVVPPFKKLTKGKTGDQIILPVKWNNIFKTDNTKSADDLLIGFFEFYVNFDYSQTISILSGQCIEKWPNEKWPMKIENPLLPDLNISRNVNTRELKTFIDKCQETACILQEPKSDGKSWGIPKAVTQVIQVK